MVSMAASAQTYRIRKPNEIAWLVTKRMIKDMQKDGLKDIFTTYTIKYPDELYTKQRQIKKKAPK